MFSKGVISEFLLQYRTLKKKKDNFKKERTSKEKKLIKQQKAKDKVNGEKNKENEGENLVVSIKSIGISNGTVLHYKISGSVNQSDFEDGQLQGSTNIFVASGTGYGITGNALISKKIRSDKSSEGPEEVKISFYKDSSYLQQISNRW